MAKVMSFMKDMKNKFMSLFYSNDLKEFEHVSHFANENTISLNNCNLYIREDSGVLKKYVRPLRSNDVEVCFLYDIYGYSSNKLEADVSLKLNILPINCKYIDVSFSVKLITGKSVEGSKSIFKENESEDQEWTTVNMGFNNIPYLVIDQVEVKISVKKYDIDYSTNQPIFGFQHPEMKVV